MRRPESEAQMSGDFTSIFKNTIFKNTFTGPSHRFQLPRITVISADYNRISSLAEILQSRPYSRVDCFLPVAATANAASCMRPSKHFLIQSFRSTFPSVFLCFLCFHVFMCTGLLRVMEQIHGSSSYQDPSRVYILYGHDLRVDRCCKLVFK